MKRTMWRVQAGTVLNGIVLLTLAGLAGSIFDAIGSVNDKADFLKSLMNNNFNSYFIPDGWDMASGMMMLLEIFGYILYFSGLKRFSSLLHAQDSASILKVRKGAILTLIGVIAGHIPAFPILWIIAKITLIIIGFVKMLSGYRKLKHSSTFPAIQGASTLYSALILQLVGILIGTLIPFIGGVIESITDLFVFFMIVDGWRMIKNATPPANKSQQEIQFLPFGKVPGGRMIASGLGIFFGFMSLINLLNFLFNLYIDERHSSEYFDLLFKITTWLSYISLFGFVMYGIGIWQTISYQGNRKLRGIKLVFSGIIIYVSLYLGHSLISAFGQNLLQNFNSWIYVITTLSYLIAWILYAAGFRHIGKTHHYGYMGTHGVAQLSAAAWLLSGIYLIVIINYLFFTNSLVHKELFITINKVLNWTFIITYLLWFILTLNGWKHLLSSWFGESDPDLAERTNVTETTKVEQEKDIQIRKEEHQHLQQEKEQQPTQKEKHTAAIYRATVTRKQTKWISYIFLALSIIVVIGGIIIWNNTNERLLVRGQKALAKGNTEKAEKLFLQAKNANKEAAFELWKMKHDEIYLEQAADLDHAEACGLYGENLMKKGEFRKALFYLKKASPSVFSQPGYQDYLLGYANWAYDNWERAKEAWERAANDGYQKAYVCLGDWYLCREGIPNYKKALEYYEKAPTDWPGIKEKKQVLKDLKKYDARFVKDDSYFLGESAFYFNSFEPRKVRRGIHEYNGYHLGKFDSNRRLLNGLGIISTWKGCIYVGNIRVNTDGYGYREGYDAHYSGKGCMTDLSTGTVTVGQWKNDKLIRSTAITNIFSIQNK